MNTHRHRVTAEGLVPTATHRFVFLSYTTREHEVQLAKSIIDPFLRALPEATFQAAGIWYDAVMIRPDKERSSRELREELMLGISQTDLTLALISPGYMRSDWCKFEWNQSNRRRLYNDPSQPIIPLCWKRTEYFRHYAAWTAPYRQGWEDLSSRDGCGIVDALIQAVVASVRTDIHAGRLRTPPDDA